MFSPLELAVLLDTTSGQRSVTLAGDTAQAIAPEHGFSNWAELLDFLQISHERVEPLRVSYRSTREIVIGLASPIELHDPTEKETFPANNPPIRKLPSGLIWAD